MYGFDGLLDSEICPSRESRLNPEDASGIALQRRSEPNLSDVWLETRLPPKGHNQPDHISEGLDGRCVSTGSEPTFFNPQERHLWIYVIGL